MSNVDLGPSEIAIKNQILRTTVGSQVHGINIEGTDDHDELGIFIEPIGAVLGLDTWDYSLNTPSHAEGSDYAGYPHYTYRTQPMGARSGPGDVDLSLYSLRKYLRLAAIGNPTVLLPLFAPREHVLHITPTGATLRENRHMFLSQRAAHRFLKYMEAQHARMMGLGKQNRVPNRPELIEKYGYDTKYASHALRLAYQGLEVIQHGTLTLPLPEHTRQLVLDVKQGVHEKEDVSAMIDNLKATCWSLLANETTPLPAQPPWDVISEMSKTMHVTHWEN